MKTILLIIALTLSASAATLYPVMTDNSGRTFSGGATNLALLSATNQTFTGTNTFNTNTILGTAKLQDTLDSKPTVALTNLARLDQSQTFTQTNTFNTNTILGTTRVGDFLGEGARWVRLFRTNQATVTINGAVTNLFCSVPVPQVLSSNAQLYFTFGAWKPSAGTATTFWEMRENTTNGPIISGNIANNATVLANEVALTRFLTLSDYTRAFGLGAAANGNNTVNTNYLGTVDWRTNNTIQVLLYNSSAATNTFTVEYFEVLYRY